MNEPFNNPFAKLKGAKAPDATPDVQAPAKPKPAPKAPPRAVVRLEKKGRGGKEVTVIEKLDLPPKEREVWLKALKSALGTGGTLEEDGAMIVQGDHRERVRAWLEARGVAKISVG